MAGSLLGIVARFCADSQIKVGWAEASGFGACRVYGVPLDLEFRLEGFVLGVLGVQGLWWRAQGPVFFKGLHILNPEPKP